VRALAVVALGLAGIAAPAQWSHVADAPGIVDVVKLYGGPLVVSTKDGLFELGGSQLTPFATYKPNEGGEQYAAVVPAVRGTACSWQRNDVYVLDASGTPGLVRVPRAGTASRVLDFPQGEFPSGITWDATGRFAHRLLVTTIVKEKTTLYAVDCRGRATVLRRGGPRVEGGIVVAPASFPRFGGRLIAANEVNGTIYAYDARGRSAVVAKPAVRAGPDLGIEALGFSPWPGATAYLSDLGAPQSPTKGSDSLLALSTRLPRGALIAVAEGGATTVVVTCKQQTKPCIVRQIADGPQETHAEGHVAFASSR
jgi:hypothetical protein